MPYIEAIAAEKARQINNTGSIYGTFAEIGAGQEVVGHFFKAGGASATVAKSMSAYDMTFSDEIYGKTNRYVSEARLLKMLTHEYQLLQKRLTKKRGSRSRFFAFANTVAVSTNDREKAPSGLYQHGWMGLRFQHKALAPFSDLLLHVSLRDKTRLQQYEALGVLGVNLIHGAFFKKKSPGPLITSLMDNIESTRVDIDILKGSGPVFENTSHLTLNRELIRQKLSPVLLFNPKGESVLHSDTFYEKNILLYPSEAKTLLPRALKQAKKHVPSPFLCVKNIPFRQFKASASTANTDGKNSHTLISRFEKFYQLKKFIRKSTRGYLFFVFPARSLKKFLNPGSYTSPESPLGFFSQLCDSKTRLLVTDFTSSQPPAKKPAPPLSPGGGRELSLSEDGLLQTYLQKKKYILPLKNQKTGPWS